MKYEDFQNKPLPEHTRLDYYECLSKLTLEKIFPNEFSKLEIKDKPDLWDEIRDIGIEITRAINPVQERNESLYTKISYNQVKDKEKAIEIINSSYKPHSITINGREIREPDRYYKGILVGIPESDDFDRILESFKKKVKKLNNNSYKIFINNYLFVYSTIYADIEMINEAIIDMSNFQLGYNHKFDKVYVFVPNELYLLNLVNKKGEIINIRNYQFDLGNKAREMVIQHEIN